MENFFLRVFASRTFLHNQDPKRTLGSFTASRSVKIYHFPKIVSDGGEKHMCDFSADTHDSGVMQMDNAIVYNRC